MKTKLRSMKIKNVLPVCLVVLFAAATLSVSAINPSPYITVKVTDSTNHVMQGVVVYAFDVSVSQCICNANANQCEIGPAASATTNWQGKAQINGSALIPNHEYILSLSPSCAFRPDVTACSGQDLLDCQFTAGINTHIITNALGGVNRTITFRYISLRLGEAVTENVTAPATLDVFPNPASSGISIDVSSYSGSVQLSIINSLGQVVSSGSIEAGEVISSDVSTLAKGIYKVMVTDNTSVSTGTFVKD